MSRRKFKNFVINTLLIAGVFLSTVYLIIFFGIYSALQFSGSGYKSEKENNNKLNSRVEKAISSKNLSQAKHSVLDKPNQAEVAYDEKQKFSKSLIDFSEHSKKIDLIEKDKILSKTPPICEILCVNEPPEKINILEVYNKEQQRAFERPNFRLEFAKIKTLSNLIKGTLQDKALYVLLFSLPDISQMNHFEKAQYAFTIENKILPAFYRFIKSTDIIWKEYKLISELKDLKKNCSSESIAEIEFLCRKKLSSVPQDLF